MCGILFGVIGFVSAGLIVGTWYGAALLIGFSPPSPDQITGLALLGPCLGFSTGIILYIVWD